MNGSIFINGSGSPLFPLDGSLNTGALRREKIAGVENLCCWNIRAIPNRTKAVFLAADVGGPHAKVASLRLLDVKSRKVGKFGTDSRG